MQKAMKIPVQGCARCGQNHDVVHFIPFTKPVKDSSGKIVATHFGSCRFNGEPVLLLIEETKGVAYA